MQQECMQRECVQQECMQRECVQQECMQRECCLSRRKFRRLILPVIVTLASSVPILVLQ
jgi:hypothetical protein